MIEPKTVLFIILIVIVFFIPILPNLWSIWHIFHHDFKSPNEKMVWIFITMFLPVIGGIVYIIFGRKKVIKKDA